MGYCKNATTLSRIAATKTLTAVMSRASPTAASIERSRGGGVGAFMGTSSHNASVSIYFLPSGSSSMLAPVTQHARVGL